MPETRHLYLHTVEIEPLEVGKSYNPLPPHLTLMSHYWSELRPDEISLALTPLFNQTPVFTLLYGDNEVFGPKHTPVRVIAPNSKLTNLHNHLKQKLDDLGVVFAYPQFVGSNWKPHVSHREGIDYILGTTLRCGAAYLIEVSQTPEGDVRFVHSKFELHL